MEKRRTFKKPIRKGAGKTEGVVTRGSHPLLAHDKFHNQKQPDVRVGSRSENDLHQGARPSSFMYKRGKGPRKRPNGTQATMQQSPAKDQDRIQGKIAGKIGLA
jgi:hypothetical protein